MKILVISSNFPPDHLGGYELRIKDIVDGLADRKHEIRVLTTRKAHLQNDYKEEMPYATYRKLHNRFNTKFFPKEVLFDLIDTRSVDCHIRSFNPNVIYLGHIYLLSKTILPYLAERNIPIVLDEGGASLKGAWTEHGRWYRFTGEYGNEDHFVRILKPFVIKIVEWLSQGRISSKWHWPEHLRLIINNPTNFEKIKLLGIPMNNAAILNSGIDLDTFTFQPRELLGKPLKILCPGRLEALKGLLDAIELVNNLCQTGIDARLTIVGPHTSESFDQKLKYQIQKFDIVEKVSFLGMIPRSELVRLYHDADICFFPTYHKMGFSRTPLEAMACGCVVISYGNEGSEEIIEHGNNGYLVSPNDYDEIIHIIKNLHFSAKEYREIVDTAREMIEQEFGIESYIDKVEAILRQYV